MSEPKSMLDKRMYLLTYFKSNSQVYQNDITNRMQFFVNEKVVLQLKLFYDNFQFPYIQLVYFQWHF